MVGEHTLCSSLVRRAPDRRLHGRPLPPCRRDWRREHRACSPTTTRRPASVQRHQDAGRTARSAAFLPLTTTIVPRPIVSESVSRTSRRSVAIAPPSPIRRPLIAIAAQESDSDREPGGASLARRLESTRWRRRREQDDGANRMGTADAPLPAVGRHLHLGRGCLARATSVHRSSWDESGWRHLLSTCSSSPAAGGCRGTGGRGSPFWRWACSTI